MHAGKTTARRRGARLVAGLASTALVGSGGLFLADSPPVVATKAKADPAAKASTLETYANLPISFEANHGQTDPQVKLMSRGPDGTLFLTPNEAVLSLPTKADTAAPTAPSVLRMKLLGANPDAEVAGAKELPGKVNYLNAEPAKSYRNVPTYARAESKAVYPGIDMAWYGKGSNLEYDFIVAPGANPATIMMGFEGAKGLRLDKTGDLIMKVGGRDVRQHKPVLYQETAGRRRTVPGRFVLRDANRIGFSVSSYDRSRPLIIDPVLAYSTYLGGSSTDYGFELEVDPAGNAYISGTTYSSDFPVRNAFQATKAEIYMQMFVTRLTRKGTPVYSTYLNGSVFATTEGSLGSGMAVDDLGNVWVASLGGPEFPTTPGAYQTIRQGGEYEGNFLAKLTSDGTTLAYSTFWSANGGRFEINGLDVDDEGDVYFGGRASFNDISNTFPAKPAPSIGTEGQVVGAYQPSCSEDNYGGPAGSCADAFVAKLHPDPDDPNAGTGDADDLIYFTYLGGQQGDHLSDIDVAGGVAYLTGDTSSTAGNLGSDGSTWFPTTSGAFDRDGGGGGNSDSWVAKLDPAGNGPADLMYSTLIGGDNGETPRSVAAGPSGTIYAVGSSQTQGSLFPTTPGAFQTVVTPGETGLDAYLVKLAPAGNGSNDLLYSTLIGGAGFEQGHGLRVDNQGVAYVSGSTNSSSFPTKDPVQKRCGCFYDFVTHDAFVVVVRPDASNASNGALDPADLLFSTWLGGTGLDIAFDIDLDAAGNIYVAGYTQGPGSPPTGVEPKGFPVRKAFQRTYGGSTDAFVAKITAP